MSTHAVTYAVDSFGRPVTYDPTTLHTVCAGATRSGKSAATYAIFAQVAENPAVAVVGVDPSGILLAPFEREGGGVVLGSSSDAIDRAIELLGKVTAEMDERNRRLGKRGLDKVPGDWISARFPAFVVVLEEYAGLLTAATKAQRDAVTNAVGRILREGAKACIHVYTVLQRPDAASLHDRAQYARRLSFRLDNGDSVRMLFEAADPALVHRMMNFVPGQGLIHEAGDPYRELKSRYVEYPQYAAHVRASIKDRPPVPVLGGTL